jgi:hypothetical protein
MEFNDYELKVIDKALEGLLHETYWSHGDGHWDAKDRNAQAAKIKALRERFALTPVS